MVCHFPSRQTVDGKQYCFASDGSMQTGFQAVGSQKYYFGTDGAMLTGWQTIGSQRYYFLENGNMATGTVTIDGKKYTFNADGTQKKIKICLDAGHYGKYNRSPVNGTYYESDMSWKLHLKLKSALEARGMEVITTRTTQAGDLGLEARGKKSAGCDLFLSLHSNAAGNGVCESVDYPVVFYPVSGKGIGLAAELAECIHKTMGTLQPAQTRVRWNSAHNADYYGVIRFTAAFGVTGMILEHSFHTNTRMTTWLLDDENLKRLAAAEAAVLAEHYGLKKTADEPQRAETVCYHLLSDVPQGDYRTVLDKLIAADILRGRSGTGEERVLDLTEDSVRLLVLLDRAGAFGS